MLSFVGDETGQGHPREAPAPTQGRYPPHRRLDRNMAVGRLIVLDQLDEPRTMAGSPIVHIAVERVPNPIFSTEGVPLWGIMTWKACRNRTQHQVVKVTNIVDSTMWISRQGSNANWRASQTPMSPVGDR